MQSLHSFLFVCHILVGAMSLMLFWVPVLSRKGSLDHRKFGRYYSNTMYAVAITGAMMAVIVLFDPMLIKGHLLKNPQNQDLFVYKVRLFWYFLLVLSLLTFVSVKHGLATLRYKSEAHKLAHKSYVTPLYLLVISGAGLLALGIKESNTLHMVFGVLSVAIGSNMLRFCRSKTSTPKRWLVEHLSAMIGSGIGAYTAFLTFGARQVNEDWGQFQLFVWIAPGVVGSIAIFFMSRKYTIRATKH